MSRMRRVLANGLLALASTAVALAGVEGAARVARHYQKGGKEQRTRLHYTEYDPLLGWKHQPGSRARYERREYATDVVINSRGLRDKERAYERPPGAFRVLALGDSFVEAFTVPFADSVTQVLERAMARDGCPAEVINGGTVGYSTDQQFLFYREEGHKYAPQVVLLFFYYNDVLYNATPTNIQLPKPLLSFKGGLVQVVNFPVPRRPPDRPGEDAPAPEVRGSVALDWVGERLERSHPRAYNRAAGLGLWPPTRAQTMSPELRVYLRKPPADVRHGWNMTHRILKTLAQEAWGRDARLALAYIPSRMEVSDRDWELTRLRYGVDETSYDRGAVAARLSDIAAAERIPLLDLTPAMREATGVLSWPYYDFDSHWNRLGHRIAAREAEGFLRRQGWTCAP
ncbi:MAG TPA: SGNH/GDSL hydrolase family protein [Vicinamibacteria bacterium]|nr:SGNH/GDSL hydrolase family protein [Vicinamibacteria bacterium]